MRQLLDIVDQRKQLPLAIDLFSSAQREAVQALVVAQIAEWRLHGTQPLAVDQPAQQTVDLGLHVGDRRFSGVLGFAKENQLAG